MYFDEFEKLCTEVTSELYVSIFDSIYQCVPCVKNFLILRHNYQEYLKRNNIEQFKPTFTVLMPPISTKMIDRMSEQIDKNNTR